MFTRLSAKRNGEVGDILPLQTGVLLGSDSAQMHSKHENKPRAAHSTQHTALLQCSVQLQALLSGSTAGGEHQFHFHPPPFSSQQLRVCAQRALVSLRQIKTNKRRSGHPVMHTLGC